MKNTLIKSFFLFIVIILMNNLSAGVNNTMDQIQEERIEHRELFRQKAHQIKNCVEKLNNLSPSIQAIQSLTQERTKACQSPIQTKEQYDQCVFLTKNIISDTQDLKTLSSSAQAFCQPFWSQIKQGFDLPIEKLTEAIQNVEKSLRSIGQQGMGQWIQLYQNIEKETYDESKPGKCLRDIIGFHKYTAFRQLLVETNYNSGNIFAFQQQLSELKITKDYATILSDICKADGFNLSSDPVFRKFMQETITNIEKMVSEIEQMVSDTVNQFNNHNFNALAKRACDNLKKKNIDTNGLCLEPTNTPEWIYSIHYMMRQQK